MRRVTRQRDESGVALVIALLFVTVIAVMLAAVLSLADVNLRTTVAVRKQALVAYTADGAAQVAINTLRNGTYTNAPGQSGFCATAGLALANFPTSTSTTAAGSAYVKCSPDPASGSGSVGAINTSNTPADAILTLGAASTAEAGVLMQSRTTSTDTFQVKGPIVSDSSFFVGNGANPPDPKSGVLKSDTSIVGKYGPQNTGCFGSLVAPVVTCASATPDPDPNYASVSGSLTARTPSCSGTGAVIKFSPGLYTDAAALNKCDNNTMQFQPGTYYFNFTNSSTQTWLIDAGALVGGTPTTTLTGNNPVMPGSCISPLTTTTPALGVQFVFGGESRMQIGGKAEVELCGSYSATSPPIAIYGLSSAIGSVPAQNGCITYQPTGGRSQQTPCALISSSDTALDNVMYVQGTVYAPLAWLNLTFGQLGSVVTGQYINDGAILRSYYATTSGVSPVGGVSVPTLTAGAKSAETDVFLQVYVCPGASSCTDTVAANLELEADVGVSDPQTVSWVAGARSIKIYSWAVQR